MTSVSGGLCSAMPSTSGASALPEAVVPPPEPALLLARAIPASLVDGPGSRLTLFLQGCNLDCVNCHNPSLIGMSNAASWRTIDELTERLRHEAPFLRGVTVSGGEATLQLEGVIALFTAIKTDPELARLTTLVDSNGTLDTAGWQHLAPVMDGAMIDVKAVDPQIHRRITGSGNAAVLRSVRTLYDLDRLHEVRLLVIEGLTDTPDELARYAGFLAGIDPTIPLRTMGFRHHGVRAKGRVWPETSPETVERVARTLRDLGLTDVRTPSVS